MKRTYFLLAMGLACQAALLAQTQPGAMGFQQADSLAAGRGGRGINIVPLLRPEAGKPFSATVTTQTTQTFLDGTHVSQTTSTMQYRDADGRTRIERNGPGDNPLNITIRDPVAGVTYNLDPARKTAVKLAMAGIPVAPASPPVAGGRGGRGGGGSTPDSNSEAAMQRLRVINEAVRDLADAAAVIQSAKNSQHDIEQDLGTMTVNGVPARGTRITTVVPVGAIGNDKEFPQRQRALVFARLERAR